MPRETRMSLPYIWLKFAHLCYRREGFFIKIDPTASEYAEGCSEAPASVLIITVLYSMTYLFSARKASQGARNICDYLSGDNSEEEYLPSGEDEAQSEGSIGPIDDEDGDLDGLDDEQARQAVQDMVS